ncbi:MAG: hypothetical protein ACIALR_04245 [Blastopirellula sp. JB062]
MQPQSPQTADAAKTYVAPVLGDDGRGYRRSIEAGIQWLTARGVRIVWSDPPKKEETP